MNLTQLMSSPEYAKIERLCAENGLDMAVMQELAIAVSDRLESLQDAGVNVTEAHVVAAIHSWTHERQAITDRYHNDPEFRAQMQERIYRHLKELED